MNQSTNPCSRCRLFLLGGLLGVFAFLLIFGTASLDIANTAFARGGFVEKDIQQHYAGWVFFRQSPWRFPLSITDRINYPQGLSVAYTDSIPLFAVFFKALSVFLPEQCQYFGWFSLWCYFMMGGYAALLLNLFCQKLLPCLMGTVLFVFSPVLAERTLHHTSLAAQFLILAALYAYFRGCKEDKLYISPWNLLILSIHPYFVPMAYAIALAGVIRYSLHNGRWLYSFGRLAASLAGALGVGLLFGVFSGSNQGGSMMLYGYFGMNLNALWNPTSVGPASAGGRTLWSLFLPVQNQVRGNYDSFAYLGLGGLLGTAASGVLALKEHKKTFAFLREHLALVICMALLTLFAVSNVVTANGATLLTIPLPHKIMTLCSIFRASGRMFWPVYYLIFLWVVVTLFRLGSRSPKILAAALGTLCLVQLVDLSPAFISRHQQLAQYQEQDPTTLTSSFWQQAAGQYQHFFTLDSEKGDLLHLALYAAESGMTTNDAFAARYDAQSLAQSRLDALNQLLASDPEPDTLYYTSSEGLFLRVAHHTQYDAWCAKVGENQYVIAPGFSGQVENAVIYSPEYPLTIEDCTDTQWDGGVLSEDGRTILLSNSHLVHQMIDHSRAIRANGEEYPILKVEELDYNWLAVTLEIEDARILKNVVLEGVT